MGYLDFYLMGMCISMLLFAYRVKTVILPKKEQYGLFPIFVTMVLFGVASWVAVATILTALVLKKSKG